METKHFDMLEDQTFDALPILGLGTELFLDKTAPTGLALDILLSFRQAQYRLPVRFVLIFEESNKQSADLLKCAGLKPCWNLALNFPLTQQMRRSFGLLEAIFSPALFQRLAMESCAPLLQGDVILFFRYLLDCAYEIRTYSLKHLKAALNNGY